jgi:hypothetical protein
MAVSQFGECTWYPIKSGHECPICHTKKGRCSIFAKKNGEVVIYRCKYVSSNKPALDGWYDHLASELNGSTVQKINIDDISYKNEPITEELLIIWNKVYRKFRDISTQLSGSALSENHYANLLSRGLDKNSIINLGCFSIPGNTKITYSTYQCSLRTAITNELLKSFTPETLIRVPGFRKVEVKGKKTYITFKNTMKDKNSNSYVDIDGFFIPYEDYLGRLVGMQYRLTTKLLDDKGKPIRYLWYASKNNSCSSPIDYHIPNIINTDDAILVTEGALKAKIASEKLGIRSLAEAGVSNYRRLIKELQLIEKHENKKYKIILALDMDKYTNIDVATAEISTVSMLKSLGYSVALLEWNIAEGKGVDDKLKISSNNFRFLSV